jgi:mannose-6-phosphate isomerase-like protein (cupin superfamily)
VHTFRNSSEATAIFINVHAPGAGFADMMRARRDGRPEEAEQFDQHDPPADGGRPVADALVTKPGEAGARDPDGQFFLAEEEVAPGFRQSFVSFDPPPLTALFVVDGTIELVVDGSETQLSVGDFALVPAGAAHALGNPSATVSRCLMFTV